jgi:hypothetical protein
MTKALILMGGSSGYGARWMHGSDHEFGGLGPTDTTPSNG